MRDVVSGRRSPRRNVAALAAIALAGSLAMGAKPTRARTGDAVPTWTGLVSALAPRERRDRREDARWVRDRLASKSTLPGERRPVVAASLSTSTACRRRPRRLRVGPAGRSSRRNVVPSMWWVPTLSVGEDRMRSIAEILAGPSARERAPR
jgi:hypothetical protein